MLQKILSSIALKIAEYLSSAIVSTVEKAVASAIEKYQEKEVTKIKSELYNLRVELINKDRLSNDEAKEFADRINNIRNRL